MTNDLTHLIGNEYETMDGLPARVVAVRNSPTYPVIILAQTSPGCEFVYSTTKDFRIRADDKEPFIRRKPKQETREFWTNVYSSLHAGPHYDHLLYPTREGADRDAYEGRIACVKVTVTFKHGDGI